MKISKVKIGILFFIVFIFLIETISFSIYKLRETEKDDIKASKDSIIEDNLHLRNPKHEEIFMPAQNQPSHSAPRYASYSSHVISG